MEIDHNRNVGIISTIKNYMSLTCDKSLIALNAGWNTRSNTEERHFNFCVPLNMLLDFCKDLQTCGHQHSSRIDIDKITQQQLSDWRSIVCLAMHRSDAWIIQSAVANAYVIERDK